MTLVTCIMPTADRREFMPAAVRMFLRQRYHEKELLILDDGCDDVSELILSCPDIRYFREPDRWQSLGEKRNRACELALGEIILHWDDDDWYADWRISYQVDTMVKGNFDLTGINRPFLIDARRKKAWEYPGRPNSPWVCGATLGYRKALWARHRFLGLGVGEDSRFIYTASEIRVGALKDNRCYVARIHEGNTATKAKPSEWLDRDFASIVAMVGRDWPTYFGGPAGLPQTLR